jgi:DMSO reductase family type II enzyme chaperone
MPTPSELQSERPRRSVFGNFDGQTAMRDGVLDCGSPLPHLGGAAPSKAPEDWRSPKPGGSSEAQENRAPAATLQSSIDTAVARTFLYRFLARVFEDPEPEGWQWLCHDETRRSLQAAMSAIHSAHFAKCAEPLIDRLDAADFDDFAASHLACFGHTVRGDCPMNEIEYGDLKADPLFQPHRLADLAAFFAAFGLEVTPDAAERIDHISIELEFMSVLAAKEAYAIEHQFDEDNLDVLRDAQRNFLREHLGRWTPAFSRRLARMAEGTLLGAAAGLLGEFIRHECARLGVAAGSADLLLRPVDEAMERLCDSCGLHGLPPGAAMAGPKL